MAAQFALTVTYSNDRGNSATYLHTNIKKAKEELVGFYTEEMDFYNEETGDEAKVMLDDSGLYTAVIETDDDGETVVIEYIISQIYN